jgi:hypothetical protein
MSDHVEVHALEQTHHFVRWVSVALAPVFVFGSTVMSLASMA